MSGMYEIWKNDHNALSEERLLAYLEGSLSKEEAREVEIWLSENSMESDALEGLKEHAISDTKKSLHQLQTQLHQLSSKRRKKQPFYADYKWAVLAIFLILILAMLGYVVYRLSLPQYIKK